MNKFDVGDYVKVLSLLEQYSSYLGWFDLDGNEKARPYKMHFKPLTYTSEDNTGFIVLAKHEHEDKNENDMIYCISRDGGNTVHLFSKNGLELDLTRCPDIVVR